MVDWAQVQSAFEPDGALLDIIVADTNLADWERVLAALPEWGYATEWCKDGPAAALPKSAAATFDHAQSGPMRIQVGCLRVHLWFFGVDEMEFDLDPAEVPGESEFVALRTFLERLGQLLQRRVVVRWEGGGPDLLVWAPETGFSLHGSGP